MNCSDKEIWDEIKNNDKKSFEILFNRYYDSLCLYSFGMVRNEEAAKEIVNDVFLKIWIKRNIIVITYGIRPYLYRSVFNACSDYIKQNHTLLKYSFFEVDDKIKETLCTSEDSIFVVLENEDIQKDIQAAIELLPPQCKTIFCLNRFELLTYNEISERLNISINTVKTQMCRSLDILRNQLAKYFEDL